MTGNVYPPPEGTTRRIVSDFFITHRSLIMPHVLEVGSARPADAWWADLRAQLGGIGRDEWTGVDMQQSECTDIVLDLCDPEADLGWNKYGSCVCAETLEHVADPFIFTRNMFSPLRPGAWIVVTTPFAFPVHESTGPDYWRFTPRGLRLLLTNAGFEQAQAWELATEQRFYYDHTLDEPTRRDLPWWIGAIARKPE